MNSKIWHTTGRLDCQKPSHSRPLPDTGPRVARYSLIDRPRSQSTSPNSVTSRRASAMHPHSQSSGGRGTAQRGRRTNNRAASQLLSDEHHGRLHQFGHPRADHVETNPQRVDSPKDEAHPEHEPRNRALPAFRIGMTVCCLSKTPPIVATLPRATRRTIGHEQNTFRIS